MRRPSTFVIGAIGVICLAWFVYFVWVFSLQYAALKSGKPPRDVLREQMFQASIAASLVSAQSGAIDRVRIESSSDEPTLGNPKAKIKIVEFVDYQCPFSRQEAPTIRAFMERHRDDVFFILRDLPILELHPDAERVAIAARCVFAQKDHGHFWEFHDRLFASQEQQSASDLRMYAQQIGVDLSAFDRCVVAKTPLAHIRASFADGVAAGVRGTPTFFVNGVKIQGAADAASLDAVIEEVRKKSL